MSARRTGSRLAMRAWSWGDGVAVVTSAAGVKPCIGCKRRQRKLNRIGRAAWRLLARLCGVRVRASRQRRCCGQQQAAAQPGPS